MGCSCMLVLCAVLLGSLCTAAETELNGEQVGPMNSHLPPRTCARLGDVLETTYSQDLE